MRRPPKRYGLARMRGDQWLRLVRCYAAKWAQRPEMTHATEQSSGRTLCGRPVTLEFDPHPTDTTSQIECTACSKWVSYLTL